jgi:O-antigen/teichoic acid export membrane protein
VKKHTIIRNFLFVLSGEILGKLLALVAVVYLARHLEPGSFGLLIFAESFLMLFLFCGTSSGLDYVGIREIAARREAAAGIAVSVVSSKLVLSLAAVAIVYLVTLLPLFAPGQRWLISLYMLTLIPFALSPDWVFRGLENMLYVGLFLALKELFYCLGVVFGARFFNNPCFVPVMRFLSVSIAAAYLLWMYGRSGYKLFRKPDLRLSKDLLLKALPIYGSSVLFLIISNNGKILLGLFTTMKDVGNYGAALRIVLFVASLSALCIGINFPALSRYYKESKVSFRNHLENMLQYTFILSMPLCLGGLVLARPIMLTLFGPNYAPAVPCFQILILVAAVIFANHILSFGLIACSREKTFLAVILKLTIVNVALSILLVRFMGTVGIALAYTLTELASIFFYRAEMNKLVHFSLVKYVAKPLLSSVVMALVLRPLASRFNLAVSMAVAALVYSAAVIITQAVTVQDFKRIIAALLRADTGREEGGINLYPRSATEPGPTKTIWPLYRTAGAKAALEPTNSLQDSLIDDFKQN